MNLTKELENCESLQKSFNSLLLSTVDSNNEPLASFAPYVQKDGNFYIFVSTLADHTMNMLQRPIASIMFIQNEEKSKNIYARERAVIKVQINELVENSDFKEAIFQQMELEQGKTINLLRNLDDFKMLELKPIHGRYVVGFGKAYDWNVSDGTMAHITSDKILGRNG